MQEGGPLPGLRVGSGLTLGNELSKETHVLTKQETLLRRSTQAEGAPQMLLKNPPANAGDVSYGILIPGSGRSPGERGPLSEMAAHSSVLAWRIPQTEEPGGL